MHTRSIDPNLCNADLTAFGDCSAEGMLAMHKQTLQMNT